VVPEEFRAAVQVLALEVQALDVQVLLVVCVLFGLEILGCFHQPIQEIYK
jgi:hypothetical protein